MLSILGAACSEDQTGLACPLLMPGALALHPDGAVLEVSRDGPTTLRGVAAAGALVAHPVWVAAGESITVAASSDSLIVAIGYGPRNAFGGYPHCRSLGASRSVDVKLTAPDGGEYLVLVGTNVGGESVDYTLTTSCTAGCDGDDAATPRCPTLADLGCGDMRCDGELERDAIARPARVARACSPCAPAKVPAGARSVAPTDGPGRAVVPRFAPRCPSPETAPAILRARPWPHARRRVLACADATRTAAPRVNAPRASPTPRSTARRAR